MTRDASPLASFEEMSTGAKPESDRVEELTRKLARAEQERDRWRAMFEDVVTSKSWRLTEPLRALRRRLRL
jgi:hypothetical protein